ncbi:unnamed protein product [Acanthoscelides obtectus]|uniref:Uncharacterized protein n=1 Tax=Acanthoscelides obtectus TaxID=200917 RepID=A0A9P0KPT5_ACAOB|nr:unnamed protein product [Acanthoscelides obtectus]CAK1667671.1 hypothetical protein AOBTE_LOCUS25979 [Acanthoscelides obtectus]
MRNYDFTIGDRCFDFYYLFGSRCNDFGFLIFGDIFGAREEDVNIRDFIRRNAPSTAFSGTLTICISGVVFFSCLMICFYNNLQDSSTKRRRDLAKLSPTSIYDLAPPLIEQLIDTSYHHSSSKSVHRRKIKSRLNYFLTHLAYTE